MKEIGGLLGVEGDRVRVPDGWDNLWGGTYGGYVAAALVHAFESRTPPGMELAGAHVSFPRPLQPGRDAGLLVETHHQGASAAAFSGRLTQEGETQAVGIAWATRHDDLPSLVDVSCPVVGPPESYATRLGGPRHTFFERDLEVRQVESRDDSRTVLQWMRLPSLEMGDEDTWSVAGLALVADMIGAGQVRATRHAIGDAYGAISLDLSVQVAAPGRGAWLLGVFDNLALDSGRTIGRGFLYDQSGTLIAVLTQQSLVRRFP